MYDFLFALVLKSTCRRKRFGVVSILKYIYDSYSQMFANQIPKNTTTLRQEWPVPVNENRPQVC